MASDKQTGVPEPTGRPEQAKRGRERPPATQQAPANDTDSEDRQTGTVKP